MTDFQQPYHDTCVDFLREVKGATAADRSELIARCRAALSKRYVFEASAIQQHFADLERSGSHMSWTEVYRAAFKAWLSVTLPVQWAESYAVTTAAEVDVVSIVVQQYEFLFHHGCTFNQDGRFVNLFTVVNDPGARLAVVLVAIVGGFAGVVFNHHFMTIADQYTNGIRGEGDTVFLEGNFFGYSNM